MSGGPILEGSRPRARAMLFSVLSLGMAAAAVVTATTGVAATSSTSTAPFGVQIQMIPPSPSDPRPLLFQGTPGAAVAAPADAVWAYLSDSNAFFTDELWLVSPGAAQYIGTNVKVSYAGATQYTFSAVPVLFTGLTPGREMVFALRADVGLHADGGSSGRALFDPANPNTSLVPILSLAGRQQAAGNYVFFSGDPSRNIDGRPHGKVQVITVGGNGNRAAFTGFEDIYLPNAAGEPNPDYNDSGVLTIGAVAAPPSAQRNCTLTIGYWKNHASAVDPLLPVPIGVKTIATSTDAITLLQYSDQASNGLNKLAGQLVAAELSIAQGANASTVGGSINAANTILAAHPNSADWTTLSSVDKAKVLSVVSALDAYNNGLTGPGHCS